MGLGKKMSFSWKLLKWIYSVLEKSSSYKGCYKGLLNYVAEKCVKKLFLDHVEILDTFEKLTVLG